jgi:hypothetical protein
MYLAHRAHHQERQIVSIQPLLAVTLCRWPCRVQIGSELPTCTRHGVTLVIYQETRYFVWLQGSTSPVQLAKITTEDWWITQTYSELHEVQIYVGYRSGAVGWGTALQAGRSRVGFRIGSLGFLIDLTFTAALGTWGSAQPLSEMSTRDISWGGGGSRRQVPRADCLETLGASTSLSACPGL